MEKFIKKYWYFPVIFSIVIYALFFNWFESLASDEAFYLNTARDLIEGKGYSGVTASGEALAFIFSSIIAIFYYLFGISELVAKTVDPLFAILNVILLFFISKKFFNEKIAFFSSIFLATLPTNIILGERILLEQVHLFFLLLTMLFFLKGLKEKTKFLPLAVISFALAFFTRYSAAAFAIIFLFYFSIFRKDFLKIIKDRYTYFSILIIAIILSLFLYYNLILFGNPISTFSQLFRSYTITTAEEPQHFYLTNFVLIPAFITPFFVFGIYSAIKTKNSMLIWFIISILFLILYRFAFLPIRELRYLIDTSPFVVIVSAAGLLEILRRKRWEKITVSILILLVVLNISAGFYAISVFASNPRYTEIKEASLWLKANCSEPVLSNAGRHVRYYAGFEELSLTMKNIEQHKNVSCILYSKYEPAEKQAVDKILKINETRRFGHVFVYRLGTENI